MIKINQIQKSSSQPENISISKTETQKQPFKVK